MNYKEYKEKLKNEYNEYKEKQKIKLDKFKRKQAENLEKFKIKNNKTKKNKIIKGGILNVASMNSINPIISIICYKLYELIKYNINIITDNNNEVLQLIKNNIYKDSFIQSLPINKLLLEILKTHNLTSEPIVIREINTNIHNLLTGNSDEIKNKMFEHVVTILGNIPKLLPQQNRFGSDEFIQSDTIKYRCSRVS